jgi:hypothetical protein
MKKSFFILPPEVPEVKIAISLYRRIVADSLRIVCGTIRGSAAHAIRGFADSADSGG